MNKHVDIGNRLRQFGEERFGNMKSFAGALGVSVQHLSPYINGKHIPGNKLQDRLRELRCDLTWLITGMTKEEIYKKSEKSDLRNADAASKKRIAELELEIKLLRSYIAPSVLLIVEEQKIKYRKKKEG